MIHDFNSPLVSEYRMALLPTMCVVSRQVLNRYLNNTLFDPACCVSSDRGKRTPMAYLMHVDQGILSSVLGDERVIVGSIIALSGPLRDFDTMSSFLSTHIVMVILSVDRRKNAVSLYTWDITTARQALNKKILQEGIYINVITVAASSVTVHQLLRHYSATEHLDFLGLLPHC